MNVLHGIGRRRAAVDTRFPKKGDVAGRRAASRDRLVNGTALERSLGKQYSGGVIEKLN
jgi:hypothetical protein